MTWALLILWAAGALQELLGTWNVRDEFRSLALWPIVALFWPITGFIPPERWGPIFLRDPRE